MKTRYIILPLLCICTAVAAQNSDKHDHGEDSTDVFFRHLNLNEVTVTGVTGETKLKHATAPVSIIAPQTLRATSSTNIIDAIAHQPGIGQLTTGGSISKPIIRGLGYNRVVMMSEGVRQEGQQWGDEHGVEVDGSSVGSVEILKGPASLMYGSDAMAGVVILHPQAPLTDGEVQANVASEYQTNQGLFAYNLSLGGNQRGFVWDARYSHKMTHAYKNKYDGYVPGSQFREGAGRLRLGLCKTWGHSWLTWTAYHLTPGIIEGERDAVTGLLAHEDGWSGHSYGKWLPYQEIKHYKLVWDNTLSLPNGYLKAIIGYQQNRRREFEEHHHHHDEHEPALYLRLHTLTYDVRYQTQEFAGWKLSTGVQGMWQQSQNLGEEYLIPAYRLFDIGLFATASKQLGQWTMNGGLRFDHRHVHGDALMEEGTLRFTGFSRNFGSVTGSVGAVWNMSEQLNLRMNLSRGYRAPNMSEMGSNGAHHGALRYEVGNQQLKPEYSLQADLGVDFTSEYVSAQVALFANRIDHYIFLHNVGEETGGTPVYRYTQGDARLLGFEAGIDIHPIHAVHFSNTFSYVDARLLDASPDTKYLPYTPAPRWSSELKWELTHHRHSTIRHHHTTDAAHLSLLNNLYIAAGLDCYLRQSHVYSADDTETVTPGYALLRLSAGTDLQVKGKKIAELYITADNLLNKAYQSHLSRLKYADEDVVTGRRGVYNMGRNITFKVVVPITF